MKRIMFALLSGLSLSSAQEAPLRVGSVEVLEDRIRFQALNVSSKPIGAVVYFLEFRDGDRVVWEPVLESVTNFVIPSLKGGPILPGKTFEFIITFGRPVNPEARRARSDYQPKLDYVLFADGTSWGTNRQKRARVIEGMRLGAASERRAAEKK